MRRSALRILLWAGDLVHQRWRYGLAGAPTACPDHRQGRGVWSFVHIEDAAAATGAALRCAAGAYNIVDDNPSELRVWLPAFARACRAPEPPQVTEKQALPTY